MLSEGDSAVLLEGHGDGVGLGRTWHWMWA